MIVFGPATLLEVKLNIAIIRAGNIANVTFTPCVEVRGADNQIMDTEVRLLQEESLFEGTHFDVLFVGVGESDVSIRELHL